MKISIISLVVAANSLWFAIAHAKALLGFESNCPTCLNGGLCLPSHRADRAGKAFAVHATRCFCPSPWIGVACEMRAQDDVSTAVRSWPQVASRKSDAHFLVSRTTPSDESEQNAVEGPNIASDALVDPPDVLVVSLLLDLEGETDLQHIDEMNVRLAAYSAICPESPCALNLVLEDVIVLVWSPSEIRLGILFAPGEGSRHSAVEKALTSQLQDDQSSLRSEALQGHLRQYHVKMIPGDEDLSKLFRRDWNASAASESVGSAGWLGRDNGFEAKSSLGSMFEDWGETSMASKCISVVVMMKLAVLCANITLERAERWWYSAESDRDEEHDKFDADFAKLHNLGDMCKVPVYPFANFIVFLFLLQARADQLTRGLGNPPKWVEYFMVVAVAGFLLMISFMFLRFVSSRPRKKSGKKAWDKFGSLGPTGSIWLICLAIAQVAQNVCVFALIYGYYTMSAEDCQPRVEGVDPKIWRRFPPQDTPLEHQICMWLFLQTFLSLRIDQVCTNVCLWKLWLYPKDDSVTESVRDAMERSNFIKKSSSFSPVGCVIILAVWHVTPQTSADKTFREICLYLLYAALLTYRLISIGAMMLPKYVRIDAESMGSVVSAASSVDYMINRRGDLRDVMYRNVRRSLLVIIYTLSAALGSSVFFLNREEGGPSESVIEPVMWAMLLTFQSIFVSFLLLAHEAVIEPIIRESSALGKNQHTMNSVIREIDSFTQLIPCLALLFLIVQRHIPMYQTARLPEWVTSNMNVIAQLMLLQLVMVLLEAVLGHQVDEVEADEVEHRVLPRTDVAGKVDGEIGQLRISGEDRAKSQKSFGESLGVEAAVLGRRVAATFFSCAQFFLLFFLCVSTQILFLAVWTLHTDDRRKQDTILSVFPVSVRASGAIYVTVYCVLMYFLVKVISRVTTAIHHVYDKLGWPTVSAIHKAEELIDLAPWIIVLCLLVQARASSFHGIHAAPPFFVTAHMYAIVIAMLVEALCSLFAITVAHSGKKETGFFADVLHAAFIFIEVIASVVLHWSVLVLIFSIVAITPESVVLPDGSNGIPWRGKGDPPKLQFIVQNLLVLCVVAFLVTLFHKSCRAALAHARQGKKKDRQTQLRLWIKLERGYIARFYHASSLARKAILDDSVQLALLFFPLATLRHPVMGHDSHREQQDKMIDLMHMVFFVIGGTLLMKTFFVFCFGYVDQPQEEKIMPSTVRQAANDEEKSHMGFAKATSKSWASEESGVLPIVQVFKRMAVTVEGCEFILFAALSCLLIVALHNSEHSIVLEKEILYATAFLFAIYMITEYIWECVVLLGYPIGRLDALLDVVQSCPILFLLAVAVRERVLEVAGRHAHTPAVITRLILAATACILLEYLVVLFAPTPTSSKKSKLSDKMQTFSEDRFEDASDYAASPSEVAPPSRIAYLMVLVIVRGTFYAIMGNILFAMLWMSEDMCAQRS